MPRLSSERVVQLREEDPEVYEAYLELADIAAQAWNALMRYGHQPSRFRGKLFSLAATLQRRERSEGKDTSGNIDLVIAQMRADGWDRDQGC